MRMHRNAIWERYVAAARRAQGAGADPAPAGKEKGPRRPSRPGRFCRAAGRAVLAAARTVAGLAEFALWAGLNIIIALTVVLAAQAAGAHLPPWLSEVANWVQAALGYLAALVLR